jgi:hypothetical protein
MVEVSIAFNSRLSDLLYQPCLIKTAVIILKQMPQTIESTSGGDMH